MSKYHEETEIHLCNTLVNLVEDSKLSIKDACLILSRVEPNKDIHPMIKHLFGIAYHIAWPIDEEDDNKNEWKELLKILEDYKNNNWYSTYYCLTVIYSNRTNKKTTKSHGALITRTNGKTSINCANKDIYKVLDKINSKLNQNQTDKRYLENFSYSLPDTVKGLKIEEISITETSKD